MHSQRDIYLMHYGIKGQKWGVRRYQNADGSLTSAGKKRQAKQEYKSAKKAYNKSFNKTYNKAVAAYSPSKKARQRNDERWEDVWNKSQEAKAAKAKYKQAKKEYNETPEGQARKETAKKVAKGAAFVAGTALVAYGGYKVHQYVRSENAKIAQRKGKEAADRYADMSLNRRKETYKRWKDAESQVEQHSKKAQQYSRASINGKDYGRKAHEEAKAAFEAQAQADRQRRLYTQLQKTNVSLQAKNLEERVTQVHNDVNFRTAAKNVYNEKRKRK